MNSEQTLAEVLHAAGYKYTQPRRAVAEVVLASQRHLTASEIVDQVADNEPTIGRMSVYRTLDLFTKLGLIRPIFETGLNARYAVITGGHHHHLICKACGLVIHFDDCPLDELVGRLETRFDFEIEGHTLEFFGVCKDCRT